MTVTSRDELMLREWAVERMAGDSPRTQARQDAVWRLLESRAALQRRAEDLEQQLEQADDDYFRVVSSRLDPVGAPQGVTLHEKLDWAAAALTRAAPDQETVAEESVEGVVIEATFGKDTKVGCIVGVNLPIGSTVTVTKRQ